MNAFLPMSNLERSALRREIAANAGWPALRASTGQTLDRMSTSAVQTVASSLGIDVARFLSDYRTASASRRPSGGGASFFGAAPRMASAGTGAAPTGAVSGEIEERLSSVEVAVDKSRQAWRNHSDAIDAMRAKVDEIERLVPREIKVTVGAAAPVTLKGTVHPEFSTLLQMANIRDKDGNRCNVWLAGPAGSGKTYAAEQVAGVLGLEYAMHGPMAGAENAIGFVSPTTGEYVGTDFVRLYENGGLCLLDELDGGSNEAALALNAPLAGTSFNLPGGRLVRRHPDFVCIAAANTWGRGATGRYIGRTRLDAAFLNRFVFLPWDYDADFERAIGGDDEWTAYVQTCRRVAEENGIDVVISPRATVNGAAMRRAGMTIDQAANATIYGPMAEEQRQVIRRAVRSL